jgi:hypothetical protein
MHPLQLPEPLAAFFAAHGNAPDAFARCFAADATVRDEGRTYQGREVIQAWQAAASARYAYTSTPQALEHRDAWCIVTSRVEGSFPGSPVDLRYRFQLERGLIAALEVAP